MGRVVAGSALSVARRCAGKWTLEIQILRNPRAIVSKRIGQQANAPAAFFQIAKPTIPALSQAPPSAKAVAVQNSEKHATTPNIPADRLKLLQAATDKVLHDPALVAEGEKSQRYIDFVSPEKTLEKIHNAVSSLTPAQRADRHLPAGPELTAVDHHLDTAPEGHPGLRVGEHAGAHLIDKHVEAFRDQPPGLAHALEGFLAVQLDLPGLAQRGCGGFDVTHWL